VDAASPALPPEAGKPHKGKGVGRSCHSRERGNPVYTDVVPLGPGQMIAGMTISYPPSKIVLDSPSSPSYDSSQGRVARMTFPLRIRLKQNSQNERIY
jgi:hypothetical protein